MQRCAGIRRPGAAALDLAYVAAGWTDGHWEKGLNAWDVGAGQPARRGGRRQGQHLQRRRRVPRQRPDHRRQPRRARGAGRRAEALPDARRVADARRLDESDPRRAPVEALGRGACARRRVVRGAEGQPHRPARPVRLRQVDAAAARRRPRPRDGRPHLHRRRRRHRCCRRTSGASRWCSSSMRCSRT